MAANASSTMRPAGWSGELQELQDETIRLLHTIRAGDDSRQKKQQSRQSSHRGGDLGGKQGEPSIAGGGSTVRTEGKHARRRRRKRRTRRNFNESQDASGDRENLGPGAIESSIFLYTSDTTDWARRGDTGLGMPSAALGMGKMTVEVLDRGKETPRSPRFKEAHEGEELDSRGDGVVATGFTSDEPKLSQVAGEDESRFRSLAFKNEEGRVRDGADTYVPGTGGIGEELKRLKLERDRLSAIEEAQREACRGTKRQQFLRFARRKWLASDKAAVSVQRVFRGYIGRRRAGLAVEARRLTGEARADWVEVRDHTRGEAWYFNPLTGKSQWDRPEALLGTITPSEKVKTLPALGPASPSKQRPRHNDPGGTERFRGRESSKSTRSVSSTSPTASPASDTSRPHVTAAGATAGAVAGSEPMFSTGHSRAQTAPSLPPLMKGSRHSILSTSAARGLAPSSGLGGELDGAVGCGQSGDRWPHKQQAWVEEDFSFLREEEILPDDRFEETGFGLARRAEEGGESHSSEDSNDDSNGGARSFFLADGTPNIRLRRTIAKALRVTKFDSVSTLLADYTNRNTASSTAPSGNPKIMTPRAVGGRAATAAPDGGSKTRKTRARRNNPIGEAGLSEAPAVVDPKAPYPTGKLEEDKNASLFASSMGGGGRKMVSVMTKHAVKSGRDDRRAKTAGVGEGERGGTLKGLAIRDLPPPGFVPPAGTDSAAAGTTALTNDPSGRADNGQKSANGDGKGERCRSGNQTRDMSGPEESKVALNGASVGKTEQQAMKEICFNCWSKGSGKSCTLHRGRSEAVAGEGGGGKPGEAGPVESALMCKNWDVGVMRRRYRSEELQEVFAKEASSLRYDKERKKFTSIVEQRHPIYRLLAKIIAGYNFTVRRKLHAKNWMRGFVEQLRMGKLAGMSPEESGRTAKTLRLRNTLQNAAQVKAFTSTARCTQPRAPITGSTLAERLSLVRVLVDRPSAVMGRTTRVVLDGPTPVPEVLYEARRYSLPPAKTMPMPEPKYLDADPSNEEDEDPSRVQGVGSGAGQTRTAWLSLFCEAAARDIVRLAVTTVEVMSPVPGADDIQRTKYPPALTIKFATFSRKPTSGMMAVGGLPAEMVVHMLVSTRMPPQYGNFTVMQKSSVAPTVSKERSTEYDSLDLLVENQAFLARALQHALNLRVAPTVTVKTLMADPEDKHYFGFNRPEQTGEGDSHGFRTSAHADAAPALATLDPTAFTPSEEIVTANLCSANRTVTTHVDRSYPFCEPSNRSNTTLDFYHLLLTATCSPNKEQVFTNLGVQECGEFMRGSDPLRPMGHCIGVVYRSWAFLQRQILEEFETDDGVPYWFDRRTGETFWERPLCEEEKVPVKEGGTILGGQGEAPDSSSGAFGDVKPRLHINTPAGIGLSLYDSSPSTCPGYDQQQMRKLMMKSHEGTDALEKRRKQVSTQVKWARSSGALPPPDPNDLEPPSRNRLESNSSQGEADEVSDSNASSFSSPNRQNDSRHNSQSGRPSDRPKARGPKARGKDDGNVSGRGAAADRLAASIAQALSDAGLNEGRPVKPSDMLRFGMGLGITLGANGLLTELGGEGTAEGGAGGDTGASGGTEASLAPPVVKVSRNGHPIGHGYADPVAEKEDSNVLDHKSEAEHLASIVRDSAGLKTSEEFKGLVVVPPAQPTPCPDEDYGLVRPQDLEADPRRKAELSIPIVAYPETLWKKQYRGHGAAGEGQSWLPAGGDRAANQRAKSSLGAPMRRTNEPLPEGFLNAISHTHVGKQHCDYLPHVPNMPQARAVGRVRPRSAAEDWFAVGFDPWSAGREPLSSEFIPSLSIKQEDLGANEEGEGAGLVPQTGYLELKDSAGHTEMAVVSAEEAKLAADFEQITSWARHARYADVETAMNQADWTMPIDYQNDLGVTLLHVAAQNGNKRIAKLCLRKGADVNKRNNNGQTPLHYAYGYGFESFGEYLISKGADDSITNADGLTCYEGLNEANLGQL